jgi:hypothetical protein
MHAMNDIERRQRRLDRARFAVHAEIAIGVAVALLTWFWFVASPDYFRPMFYQESLEQLRPWIALGGPVIGLAWMVRLARPDPEPDEPTWRFRDF